MNSNVSKFLVKSILSTAFAATVTSGYVNGTEKQQEGRECIICLEPVGTCGGKVSLHKHLNDPEK